MKTQDGVTHTTFDECERAIFTTTSAECERGDHSACTGLLKIADEFVFCVDACHLVRGGN